MSFISTLLAFAPAFAGAPSGGGDLVAIKVGRAETVSHGVIEHAVILVEKGRIVAIGQDLAVERGIPVIDRPEWVAMPGLVNPYSRVGLDGKAGSDFSPEVSPTPEILPRHRDYDEVLEAGVTTLGIYPPGTGVPGHAAVIHPRGDTLDEMLDKAVRNSGRAYLKVYFRSDARSKKMVKDAWAKVDEYDEKVKKAKEKFDKDNAKKKPSSSDKKDEEKKDDAKKEEPKKDEPKSEGQAKEPPADEKKDDAKDGKDAKVFVPPPADPKVEPFVQLRDGKFAALVSVSQSSDWLHWLDAIGERKLEFALRVPMTRELDLYEIKKEIGERGVRVVMEPELSLHPGTMRQRNLPMELSQQGAKLVLIPRNDTVADHREWLRHVGEVIRAGLDRKTALEAVTLEAAKLLGLEGELGSLDQGKRADLVFLDGDPFEPTTRVKAVMLGGEVVFGEVKE